MYLTVECIIGLGIKQTGFYFLTTAEPHKLQPRLEKGYDQSA